ncbi:trypsin-like peptidase domain-containing protein [Streptomyces sp. NPDC047009]|uniref:trypsin-like peptidase domain-containing protein n=1 Tax=unclassified Streptomyces TaxID=2593676 RepID=UPI0033C4BE5C
MSISRSAVGRLVLPGPGGRPLGTAFAVNEHTLLTAFHCVGNRVTGKVERTHAELDLDGLRIPWVFLTGDPAADCAVLRLNERLPATARPLTLAERVTAQSWRAVGFPASLADLGRVTVSGSISDVEGQLRGVPALQLYADQSAAGLALGGLSGAPVFAGTAPGVVGLIRYNPPHPDAAERGLGGIVYACPAKALRAVLDLVGIQPSIDTSRPRPTGATLGTTASRAALPPDRLEFTGRHGEIERIMTALASPGAVVAVHGQPGVGKSALAVHVAHLLVQQYPDALLHIDLRGADRRPVATADALERLLLALGLPPDAVAATEAERAGQYRELLNGNRALILLDNAHSAAQIRPLLPGTPTSAALVTSRQPMSTLDRVDLLPLQVLTPAEAVSLLEAMLPDDPRTRDRAGVDEIVRLCDYLPLAIRIAAAQLRSRPHWTVRHLATRLADERRRLSILEVDDLAVRASFDSSYVELPPSAAQAFAALGGLRGPDFPAWALAALLDIDPADAEDRLEELVAAQLVAFARLDVTGSHRYRCHDLVRVYAAEKAAERFDEAARRASRERLYSGYLTLLLDAMSDLGPGKDLFLAESVPIVWRPPDEVVQARRVAGAVDWFTDERESLVATARLAYEDRLWPYVWGIIDVLNGLFYAQRHGAESLELKDLALKAAREARDPVAEADVLYSYASYYLTTGAHPKAVAVLHDVRKRYKALGMSDREARMTLALGYVERDRGQLQVAARLLEECLDLYRDGDNEMSFAATEHNYAIVLREQGWLSRAADTLAHCIPVFRAHGDNGLGRLLHTRALLNMYLGRFAAAEADLNEARPHCVSAGDARWTAIVDLGQARLLGRRRRWAEMLDRLRQVERTLKEIEEHLGTAQVWRSQAMALRETGDLPGALALYAQAAAAYEDTDDHRTKARLTYGKALTLLRSGDLASSSAAFATAGHVFVDLDDQPWLLRTRRWQAVLRSADEGGAAAVPVWTEVRQIAATLIDRAGPDYFPAWLRPILRAAGGD